MGESILKQDEIDESNAEVKNNIGAHKDLAGLSNFGLL